MGTDGLSTYSEWATTGFWKRRGLKDQETNETPTDRGNDGVLRTVQMMMSQEFPE